MNNTIYLIAVITVIAIVTWALRAFPFLLFGSRPLPKTIQYLGKVLPPAIMTMLVIYCLRDTNIGQFPYGVPEFIACTLIVILQILRKNMYLSIIVGYPANLKEKHVFVYHCRNCFLYVFNSCCVNTESRFIPQFLHS